MIENAELESLLFYSFDAVTVTIGLFVVMKIIKDEHFSR